jgi:hypothetical protein
VTELKTPLDERALDRLTLATDAAVVAYQEQRLELQAARDARHNRQRTDLAQTQTGQDDEIIGWLPRNIGNTPFQPPTSAFSVNLVGSAGC